MIPSFHTHPFCRFCVQVREQANEALCTLKERHDLNAELLLFCYWFAANNQGLLSKAHIKHLLTMVYAWHQKIVSPLEKLYSQLSHAIARDIWTPEDSPYQSAESALLTAAQIEQTLLADAFPKKTRRNNRAAFTQITAHACLNVATYCQTVYVSLDETDYDFLAAIANTVFPEADMTKTRALIRHTLCTKQGNLPLQKKLPLFSSE